jgi:hypothetical protein
MVSLKTWTTLILLGVAASAALAPVTGVMGGSNHSYFPILYTRSIRIHTPLASLRHIRPPVRLY